MKRSLDVPLAAVQGLWLKTTIRMPPQATGMTTGTVGTPLAGDILRVAVLGDSTAAGCGVERLNESFTSWLALELSSRRQRPVQWQVVGQFGATARRVRHRLLAQVEGEVDVAVLLVGGNDAMGGRRPEA